MLFLSIGTQMIDIAEGSSEKAIAFASDMEAAIDCATAGIPLEKCSPDLAKHDFEPDVKEFQQALNETQEQLTEILEDHS
jgi:hypothetical protein